MLTDAAIAASTRVDLYWLPLGAGEATQCVRNNGRIFEWFAARRGHREPLDLYHSALVVQAPQGRFTIEMTPVWDSDVQDRGVVAEGAVGLRWLGRARLFRYEIRCWRDGVIPDLDHAVGSPQRLSTDAALAESVVRMAPGFPTATWGRDELHTGDMWNSNSLVSWLLASSGHDVDTVIPPPHGRAPGWAAGLVVARRSTIEPHTETHQGAAP